MGQLQGQARKSSLWERIRATSREVQGRALVHQQCSSVREQEPEPFYKYQVKEGKAPTAVSHSTSLRLNISVIKIGPDPRVPNTQEEGDVVRSMTVKLLRV